MPSKPKITPKPCPACKVDILEFNDLKAKVINLELQATALRKQNKDMRAVNNDYHERAEQAEKLLIQLGRESYAAIHGWWPEDFEQDEGKFTILRAVEAIKAECQLGRDNHIKLTEVEASVDKLTATIDTLNLQPCPQCKHLEGELEVLKPIKGD
jgi:hypothetical protein